MPHRDLATMASKSTAKSSAKMSTSAADTKRPCTTPTKAAGVKKVEKHLKACFEKPYLEAERADCDRCEQNTEESDRDSDKNAVLKWHKLKTVIGKIGKR